MNAAKDWAEAHAKGADIHAAADREWMVKAEDQGFSRGSAQFGATEAKSGNAGKKGAGRRTQAELLIEIAAGDDIALYRSPDGTGYADVEVNGHRETWSLKSTGFRRYLRRRYYEKTGGAPNGEAMAGAMGIIEAIRRAGAAGTSPGRGVRRSHIPRPLRSSPSSRGNH